MKYVLALIASIGGISCSGGASEAAALPPDDQALATRIDQFMMSGLEKGYAGTLLVAKGGNIILNKGYGQADRERKVSNTPDTTFDIGSDTKQFTAAAIMKLVDQGKLSTTNTLDELFASVPDDKAQITVHQLLTHTAGFQQGFGGDFEAVTKEEFLVKAFTSELLHTDQRYSYSNAGYSILAAIIEKASGQDYETYLRENLFEPARLTHTGYFFDDLEAQSLAKGYWHGINPRGSTAQRYADDGQVSWNLVGNGGLHSTPVDIYRWIEALKTDKVLSKSSRDQMFGRHVRSPSGPARYLAYGWVVRTAYEGKTLVNHNGGNGVFFTAFAWYLDGDVTIIYANNTSVGEWPAYEVHKMIFEPDYKPRAFSISPHRVAYEYVSSKTDGRLEGLPEHLEKNTGKAITQRTFLNRVGIAFEEEGRYDKSVAIFKLNTELFPNDGYLWASLGEGYEVKGDAAEAIASYQKSLDLAPDEGCSWCADSHAAIAKLKEY
ncbi:MAG: serine hydrolase [Erythrobacter sp.]|uniref:serine hydrolase n=1 Tax=Erythrobacter sp. TaxID=1042 RepID=UPI0032675AE5